MSSSAIAIPKRKQPLRNSSGSYQSSFGATPSSYGGSAPYLNGSPSQPGNLSKKPVRDEDESKGIQERRPSLLGSSFSQSSYTVVNLGREDGPPRLVSCIKSSQGFDWNQELFLPSYIDHDSHDLEHRPDPVQEIVLTDEEAAAILPQ